jgi:mono/diheme cytochrome c family protein
LSKRTWEPAFKDREEKMRRMLIISVGVLAMALVFTQAWAVHVGSVGTPTLEETAEAKAVFEQTCSKCHGLDRPLGKKKDADGWRATVSRMSENHKAKFGEPISEEDQSRIRFYLLKVAEK